MTKQQTNILKGVAILMMIFLHLFNRVGADYHGLCQPLLYICERPLVNIIANACHPVAFFLILSGYGLSYVWENKGNNLRQQGRRILKLYISYWIVMAIFVGMGCFINPAQYPGDFWSIIGNITAVKTTWNYETWFLFPYVLLSMTSMWLFRMMDRLGNKVSFIVAFFLSFGSAFIISRCSAKEIDINPVINVVLVYCDLLLDFILGALLYRYAARKKIQHLRVWQASALLVLLVGLEMLSSTQADDSFYAFFVILLILQFPYQNRMWGAFLANLGRHSMPMWMCHTFLSIYLFPNFIYGFRYPLLIFVVLTALSYAISIVVHRITVIIESALGLSISDKHTILTENNNERKDK